MGTVGTPDRPVSMEYSSYELPAGESVSVDFQQALQALLDTALARVDPYPFTTKLQFNQRVIQRYLPGQLGITPHRDSLRAVNLIALVNVFGEAAFYLCDDRQGNNPVLLDTTPGNIIFLRAPGFLNATVRPFHCLTDIRSTRYSLGLRQQLDKP